MAAWCCRMGLSVMPDLTDPVASCGTGTIDGAVWRPGDPVKHLGPPGRLAIGMRSALFSTRCGLDAKTGDWRLAGWGEDDDCWCPGCLRQAGIAFTLYEDDDE
jgi:hypothetical protein